MPELITEKKLCEKLNCCKTTLNKYICRAEFFHIKRIKISPGKYLLKNITEEDIIKFEKLIRKNQKQ